MNEMYWITRLDPLHDVLITLIVFGVFALIAYIIGVIVFRDSEKDKPAKFLKRIKIVVVIGFISLIGKGFVPTKNEFLIIYGLGGVVDYIKQNDIAKQIPDKYIQALDVWVGEVLEDEKEELKQ